MSSALTLNPNIEKYFYFNIFFRESPKDKNSKLFEKNAINRVFQTLKK